jgi:hypothetical protein
VPNQSMLDVLLTAIVARKPALRESL